MRPWLTGVLSGLLYGVLFSLGARYLLSDHGWSRALIAGAVSGPLFGIATAIMQRRADSAVSSLPGDLTSEQRRTAARASRHGPIPTDPAIQAAALALAQEQLNRYGPRWMRALLFVLPILFLLTGVSAVLDDDEWWKAILRLACAVVFGRLAFEPYRFRRRIAVLSASG